jgi:NH3-dependent NAD+ synthetase
MTVRPDVPTPHSADEKERALIAWLREHGSALLGFSGGVDSAYLASVAAEALGRDRYRRDERSAVRVESFEPLLLLQDGVVG